VSRGLERVGEGGFVPPWVRYQHVERYRWAAEMAAGKRVLDAACGTGYGTTTLAEAGAASAVGLDVDRVTVDTARRGARAENLTFEVGDVCELPFADGVFDLFVSFETVEHLADPARFPSEARRVLAPGGVFLCSTPNREVTNPGSGVEDRPYNPFHVREYAAPELAALLREAFPVVTMYGQSFYPAGYVQGLRLVAERSRRLAVRAHQLTKLARVPFDRQSKHRPRPCAEATAPEIIVAMCTRT
jgi:SAM-dependent methyltransferase